MFVFRVKDRKSELRFKSQNWQMSIKAFVNCFAALMHSGIFSEDGQLSCSACILSKALSGISGDNAKPLNISEEKHLRIFQVGCLNVVLSTAYVAASQMCHNVLGLPQFSNLKMGNLDDVCGLFLASVTSSDRRIGKVVENPRNC